MADVTPPLDTIRPATPGEHEELEQLRRLAAGLSPAYHLFHGVDWAQARPQGDQHGELDVVVVNQAGDVAVLEVKSGEVQLGPQGVHKRYQGQLKDLGRQAAFQFQGIHHRLKAEGLEVRLLHLLVLPQQRVDDTGSVAFPRERIADAEDCQDLAGFIARRLGPGAPHPSGERVRAFFANRLRLTDDVAVVAGRLEQRVRLISGGLAEWVPRLHCPGGVLRVVGTAGSGKTQLALRLLRDAVAAGRPAAYVCFNRPLADHMRGLVPAAARVATYHQLAWEAGGRPAGSPDHQALSAAYAQALAAAEPDLELLLIDELQDFEQDWVAALLLRLRPEGRVVLLDDPDQCLYPDRAELDIPEAVTLTSMDNFRSPRRVVETVNLLRLTRQPVLALSPHAGQSPAIHRYRPEGGSLLRATAQAVQEALDLGFAPEDVQLISWRGVAHSRLFAEDRLGDWALARFTGHYDGQGRPLWTDGPLRLDTLRRSKGQSAPAVVLTEVDFESFGPLERRLLFVGMTRARLHLSIVLSERAEAALAARLQDGGVDDEALT